MLVRNDDWRIGVLGDSPAAAIDEEVSSIIDVMV
jgi:hypothetical protein